MRELTAPSDIRRALETSRTIAVLGAHHQPSRPAFYVPAYLYDEGYRVLPVNATLVGRTLWGQPVRASLCELGEPVDMVDVFRRAEALGDHLDDILSMSPRPRLVWLQLGIRHDAFAARLVAEGIEVVQSRCTLTDHRAMGLPPIPR